MRQKQAIEAQLKQEQKDAETKAVNDAKIIADKSSGDADLLLQPDQRGHED